MRSGQGLVNGFRKMNVEHRTSNDYFFSALRGVGLYGPEAVLILVTKFLINSDVFLYPLLSWFSPHSRASA